MSSFCCSLCTVYQVAEDTQLHRSKLTGRLLLDQNSDHNVPAHNKVFHSILSDFVTAADNYILGV